MSTNIEIIEIKAKVNNSSHIRVLLKNKKAKFLGEDHQIDTYFVVPTGRLKLREGNIENSLIFYNRKNIAGPKRSKVILAKLDPRSNIKELLKCFLKILVVVDKKREIYFIDNVKIHIDSVKKLGSFVEIEAIDKYRTIGLKKLKTQCDYYIKLFKINKRDMINKSYSDLILDKRK